jgi:hypothetical protein
MKEKPARPNSCKYNGNIECITRDKCEKCGWNPTQAAQRRSYIKRKRVRRLNLAEMRGKA